MITLGQWATAAVLLPHGAPNLAVQSANQITLRPLGPSGLLNPLPTGLVAGNDMRMRPAVLEEFWPSRRMDAFDQFCS